MIGAIAFVLLVAVIISITTNTFHPSRMIYKDCHEVNVMNKMVDGVYSLNLNGTQVWTYCKNGSTLIQQRNPSSGNNKKYFQRQFKEYEEGFGFVEKELFIGLEHILQLNENKNNILQVEGIRQDDGTKIMVEFNNFSITKEAYDDIGYNFGDREPVRIKQTVKYPIISLGNQTSSSGNEGKYIFLNPTYLKYLEEKRKERYGRGRFAMYGERYHDFMYASFSTFDMVKYYECGRKYKSGWWYPYGISKKDNYKYKEECQYTQYKPHTNLNGFYEKDIEKNQRQIILCNKPEVEVCFSATNSNDEPCNYWSPPFCRKYGWTYNHTTTTIKLTETRMWLRRP